MRITDTIEELDKICENLRNQGVTVDSLNHAISELKSHQERIEQIEKNIEAIRLEVISPIKDELNENRVAGKFSVFGFWIGALGLVVSILTLAAPLFQSPPLASDRQKVQAGQPVSDLAVNRRLDSIEELLILPREYKLEPGKLFLTIGARTKLLSTEVEDFSVEVGNIAEWPKGSGLRVGVRFFRHLNQVGPSFVRRKIARSDGQIISREWFDDSEVCLAAGDVVTFNSFRMRVLRIYSRKPSGRLIGDDRDGVSIAIEKE